MEIGLWWRGWLIDNGGSMGLGVVCVGGFIGLGIVCGYGCCVRVVADVGCGVEFGVWLWRRSVCGVEIL